MSYCINPSCPNPENPDTQLFCQACGSQLLFEGHYRARTKLGGGSFGTVYEVDAPGTPKVLKVLQLNSYTSLAEKQHAVSLFQREGKVLSQLNHPGIPRVEADGYFTLLLENGEVLHCLVMEKIEGQNLQEWMQQRGNRPITQELALQWLRQLAGILHQVHSQNFFHRDIKASNIMLADSGQLVLVDFGTVRELTDTYLEKLAAGEPSTRVSSGFYSPAEQRTGMAVPASDFFALGRTFVCLLTGKSLHQLYDDSASELRWREEAPNLAPVLADFIDRLMARNPADRPQSAEEILQKLAEIEQSLGSSDHTEVEPVLDSPTRLEVLPAFAPNPFGITGPIKNPADFFDREELMRQLFEELARGGNRSLVGVEQIGKTSILWMVCKLGPARLQLPASAFIYLDIRCIGDEEEFFEALCYELGIDTCRGYKLSRALRGQRYILCLDEIDKLTREERFTGEERTELCGLADGADAPLTLVIASQKPLKDLFPDSPYRTSPLAGICPQIDVLPFSPEVARAFLSDRLQGTGVTFSESQISALLEESQGHPARLQRAAADLYRQLRENSSP